MICYANHSLVIRLAQEMRIIQHLRITQDRVQEFTLIRLSNILDYPRLDERLHIGRKTWIIQYFRIIPDFVSEFTLTRLVDTN